MKLIVVTCTFSDESVEDAEVVLEALKLLVKQKEMNAVVDVFRTTNPDV